MSHGSKFRDGDGIRQFRQFVIEVLTRCAIERFDEPRRAKRYGKETVQKEALHCTLVLRQKGGDGEVFNREVVSKKSAERVG